MFKRIWKHNSLLLCLGIANISLSLIGLLNIFSSVALVLGIACLAIVAVEEIQDRRNAPEEDQIGLD